MSQRIWRAGLEGYFYWKSAGAQALQCAISLSLQENGDNAKLGPMWHQKQSCSLVYAIQLRFKLLKKWKSDAKEPEAGAGRQRTSIRLRHRQINCRASPQSSQDTCLSQWLFRLESRKEHCICSRPIFHWRSWRCAILLTLPLPGTPSPYNAGPSNFASGQWYFYQDLRCKFIIGLETPWMKQATWILSTLDGEALIDTIFVKVSKRLQYTTWGASTQLTARKPVPNVPETKIFTKN